MSQITCPHCNQQFPLTEALKLEIAGDLKQNYENKIEQARKAYKEKSEQIKQQREQLEKDRAALDDKLRAALKASEEELRQKITAKVKEEADGENKELRNQLEDTKTRLKKANEAEIQIRKERAQLETEKEELELKVAREIDTARKKIQKEATERTSQEYELRMAEKEEQLESMRKQIEGLKRKAEQGSMQTQGEAFETQLEEFLQSSFPHDLIEPVPKGIRGGDSIHHVKLPAGFQCGTILWECKNTKHWGGDWVAKLKDDQRDCKADISILVSACLPKEIKNFGLLDGVWVTDFASAHGLALAVREHLIEVAMVKEASVDKQDKMEFLYNYLSGPEFKGRVEAIIETFEAMREDLEKEKRAMQRIWNKREKQIERITTNTSGMHGDLAGIIGTALPEIPELQLETIVMDEEDPEEEIEQTQIPF